jgi:putative DNA primase/helicase
MMWDGSRWTPDTTGEVNRLAKQTVRRIYLEANEVTDADKRDSIIKHAVTSESANRIRNMLELAATEPELSTTPDMLDSNPWFLNVENGTVDLRTGTLRPHRREDLITKLAPVQYDPNANAPLWNKFLTEIMSGDTELVNFLQRAVGYALTGDTREECLFFCYGQGSNGKSTFLETLRSMLGEYARQTDFNTFLAHRFDSGGPRTDIARLHGARLVTASEADSEKGFDSKLIKMLTGSDTVTARKLYESETEFKPQHKLFLAANHKPIVKEQTEGFWRRIRLIPFTAVFTADNRDKRLAQKLLKEIPGILNWAIDGCIEWRKTGLHEPIAVKRATRHYRDENDILGEFLITSSKMDPASWVSTAALYQAFTDWWMETRGTGQRPVSMGWFTRLLAEKPEFKPVKRKNVRGWKGIALKVRMT